MQRNTIQFICSFFYLFAMAIAPPAGAPADQNPLAKLSGRQKVVVLSLGGLKKLYVDSKLTPNLDEFYNKYASANYLKPVFPPKTSVNHFSIATGLHADKHGVIYDCKYDEEKPSGIDPSPSQCEYEQYNQKLNPIWIDNQMKGGVSGVLNWPGSNQKYQGHLPIHHVTPEDGYMNPQMKMKKIISWLEHEKQPANLVMAYFDELDSLNHQYEPVSNIVRDAIQRMDALVKDFIDSLERKKIKEFINVIIIGTQGIHTAYYHNSIDLIISDLLGQIPYKSMGANAVISPRTASERTEVYNGLKRRIYNLEEPPYNVYKHDEIPEKWHLKDSSLLKNKLLLVANPGHFFWTDYLRYVLWIQEMTSQAKDNQYPHEQFAIGMDGYDNESECMMSFFVGMGPNFMPRLQMESFYTIDIHPLIRELLQLKGSISNDQPVTLLNENIKKLLRGLVFTTMEDIENTNREVKNFQSNIYENLPCGHLISDVLSVIWGRLS